MSDYSFNSVDFKAILFIIHCPNFLCGYYHAIIQNHVSTMDILANFKIGTKESFKLKRGTHELPKLKKCKGNVQTEKRYK